MSLNSGNVNAWSGTDKIGISLMVQAHTFVFLKQINQYR